MEDLHYRHICWAKMKAQLRVFITFLFFVRRVFYLCPLFYEQVIDLFMLPLDLRCGGVALTHQQCPRVRRKDTNAT